MRTLFKYLKKQTIERVHIMKLSTSKNRVNETPGTLKYSGNYKGKMKIEVLQYDNKDIKKFSIKTIDEILHTPKIQWINIIGLNNEELLHALSNKYNIHRIDMEDIVNVTQRSKIEHKQKYLFSIYKMIYLQEEKIIHEHISIFMFENILITFQETPGDVFETIRERLEKKMGQIRKMKVDYLYYSLIDCMVDQYSEILMYIEEKFSETETRIIEVESDSMDDVYELRKELLYLKNGIYPIRDALQSFINTRSEFLSEDVTPYFADVVENIAHAIDKINVYREMVNSLYEVQISNASTKMNKVMMTLTIFSVIFIPLSFLAGVFGMNFASLPGISAKGSFIYFIIGCIIIAISMLLFFKRKKWF